MSTSSDVALIKKALADAGVHVADHPAKNLPRTEDGWIAPAAVLLPVPTLGRYTRASGGRSGGEARLLVYCVGHDVATALDVADDVERILGGLRLPGKGSTLRQTVALEPATEPNSDPTRVSAVLEYTAIRKG